MSVRTRNEVVIRALVTGIKSSIAKGDASQTDAQKHYADAGRQLKELKAAKPDAVTWEKFVKDKCGISRRRADELIQLVDGRTTIEKMREGKRQSVRKFRQRQQPALRSAGARSVVVDVRDARNACDVDWHKDPPIHEFDSPVEAYKMQAKIYAQEARQDAESFPLLAPDMPSSAITEEILMLVRQAANAWTYLLSKLERRKIEAVTATAALTAATSGQDDGGIPDFLRRS